MVHLVNMCILFVGCKTWHGFNSWMLLLGLSLCFLVFFFFFFFFLFVFFFFFLFLFFFVVFFYHTTLFLGEIRQQVIKLRFRGRDGIWSFFPINMFLIIWGNWQWLWRCSVNSTISYFVLKINLSASVSMFFNLYDRSAS